MRISNIFELGFGFALGAISATACVIFLIALVHLSIKFIKEHF